jgi:lycopene cyclase domain-containing protein
MNFLYLFLDLAALSITLSFSFYKPSNFSKTWPRLLPAIAVPAVFFIGWDVLFTHWGVWGFNETYLTGFNLFNLPIEEVLFFVCIPYACVFTYFAVNTIINKDYFKTVEPYITWLLIIGSGIVGLIHLGKWYTASTFLILSLFLLSLKIIVKPTYLSRFYMAFLFILIPFFVLNGILTGTGIDDQVVWYNNAENLGIRLGTIPVEDVFYGFLMNVMNVTVYEQLTPDR